MYKRILFSLLAITLTLSFSSCDEEDLKLFASMSCEIDGQEWDSAVRATTLQTGKFVITGTSLDGKVVVITILGSEEGTYSLALNPPAAECGAVYKASASISDEDAYVSSTGEVVLTKVDTDEQEISGTFEFSVTRLTETFEITDGEFEDISYTFGE